MIIDLKKLKEVRHCPFCGNDESINLAVVQNLGPDQFRITCAKCYASAGIFNSPEEAIEAWNKRIGEAGF